MQIKNESSYQNYEGLHKLMSFPIIGRISAQWVFYPNGKLH